MIPKNVLNTIFPDTVDAETIKASHPEIRSFYKHKRICTHEERVKMWHELPWIKTGPTPYMIKNGIVFSCTNITLGSGKVLTFDPKTLEWLEN